ncbi:Arsenic transporting ATPase [Halomicronema hongdechloris C2206]|uniref:Arsenic transporting ATPase n=1 Tax=Halomicronema hongdechloris C2206 TaxID=1641165 RepID=A0A1Z3HGG0_9CYAN|nr:ArsA family ATPase [Halomicronema hongdechloris]ASC69393.1 Arsenic transporting ATPase [Halomicronema hongdechloris C2206]
MAFILTFLGKGGSGRSTLAIATAQKFARQGKAVLLATQDAGPVVGTQLGQSLTATPQSVETNLWAMQLRSATLLEQSWDAVKALEAQYLRTPFFKEVYGQELGVLPGMDEALALDALRRYDASGDYDVIVYDGAGDQTTLRMFGLPEILDWYLRRFRQVFEASDLGKALSPFIQPIANAVLAGDWAGRLEQPSQQAADLLGQGRTAINDPTRVLACLVTTPEAAAVATARHLWGGAQQIGLAVGAVLVNQTTAGTLEPEVFAPLSNHAIPALATQDWAALIDALPDFNQLAQSAPRPIVIDVPARRVSLFLPSFDKTQVTLTQYGPEVTVEAGDQRRNLLLPEELRGRPVQGAKFQDRSLVISF